MHCFSDLAKVQQAVPNISKELHNSKSEMANKRREEAECAENVRLILFMTRALNWWYAGSVLVFFFFICML